MTLHLKSRGYPFRPRVLFSSFIVVGVGFPNCVLFQERTQSKISTEESFDFLHRLISFIEMWMKSFAIMRQLYQFYEESLKVPSFIHLQYYEEVWAMPFFANFADV